MAGTFNSDLIKKMHELYSSLQLVEIHPNKTAFANIVYEVKDEDGGEYFIRILLAQKPENVLYEIEIHKRLNAAGLVSPEYLRLKNGNFVGQIDGYSFTISKKINGQIPEDISLALIKDFGATLAKIHNALAGIALPKSELQWLNPQVAKQDLDRYSGEYKAELSKIFSIGNGVFNEDLPRAVIHGDFWFGNVYAKNDKITAVFDLETAESNLRIIDIARTYLSMRTVTDLSPDDIQKAIIAGYNSQAEEKLTNDELSSFKLAECYAAGVCATWMLLHDSPNAERFVQYGQEALTAASSN